MDSNTILIENKIEKKINDVLEKLPLKDIKIEKNDFFNLNLYDIYKNTLQTIIDIINDLIELFEDKKYIKKEVFYERLYKIFIDDKRLLYIGIIIIFLSFIIYFIDGATI